jgi:hypothetical protein
MYRQEQGRNQAYNSKEASIHILYVYTTGRKTLRRNTRFIQESFFETEELYIKATFKKRLLKDRMSILQFRVPNSIKASLGSYRAF